MFVNAWARRGTQRLHIFYPTLALLGLIPQAFNSILFYNFGGGDVLKIHLPYVEKK